jgi:hypothetical protein
VRQEIKTGLWQTGYPFLRSVKLGKMFFLESRVLVGRRHWTYFKWLLFYFPLKAVGEFSLISM